MTSRPACVAQIGGPGRGARAGTGGRRRRVGGRPPPTDRCARARPRSRSCPLTRPAVSGSATLPSAADTETFEYTVSGVHVIQLGPPAGSPGAPPGIAVPAGELPAGPDPGPRPDSRPAHAARRPGTPVAVASPGPLPGFDAALAARRAAAISRRRPSPPRSPSPSAHATCCCARGPPAGRASAAHPGRGAPRLRPRPDHPTIPPPSPPSSPGPPRAPARTPPPGSRASAPA